VAQPSEPHQAEALSSRLFLPAFHSNIHMGCERVLMRPHNAERIARGTTRRDQYRFDEQTLGTSEAATQRASRDTRRKAVVW
jgi:hypothetical protein